MENSRNSQAGRLIPVVVLPCFLLSGASGLIYEVVWTRMLALVFGGTTLAVSTVLSAFLGGLALGSFLIGKRADRIKHPLLVYGVIEIAVGCYALLTPALFASPLFSQFWKTLANLFAERQFVSFLVRFSVCSAVLIVPTAMMGATLPILGRFVASPARSLGLEIGKLYTVNTGGAVLGVWCAGFWLLPSLGVKNSILAAALVNILLGATALALGFRERRAVLPETPTDARDAAPEPSGADARSAPLLGRRAGALFLGLYAVSGFSALMLEVAWSRALSLILGSSTYAFTTMLGTFLIGLALGGLAMTASLGRIRRPWFVLAALQVGIALTAFATLYLLRELPWWFVRLAGAARHEWTLLQFLRALVAGAILFAPTFLFGMIFPLAVRLYARVEAVGQSVGKLYALNTVGSIFGSFAAGFWLLPVIGVPNIILAAAILNLALGAVLGEFERRDAAPPADGPEPARTDWRIAAAFVLGTVFLVVARPAWNPALMSAGVSFYLDSLTKFSRAEFEAWASPKGFETVFYRDGLTSTVTVQNAAAANHHVLRNNGKIEGLIPTDISRPSAGLDLTTQTLLGALPVLVHPGTPGDVLVIGHGTGMTAAAALRSSEVKHLKILEIEPEVFAADRFFRPGNGNPLDDPRCRPVVDDARNFLMTTGETFDVIISQPAEPWITGSATLFTVEHWRTARARMRPDGLFCQWIQIYGLPPAENLSLVKTFREVFANTLIFHPDQTGEVLLIGSSSPWKISFERLAERCREPRMRQFLQHVNILRSEQIPAQFVIGPKGLEALAANAPLNTDDNALIEFSGPRSMYLSDRDTYLTNFQTLFSASENVAEYLTDLGRTPLEEAEALARLSEARFDFVRPMKASDPVWALWNKDHLKQAQALAEMAYRRHQSPATRLALDRLGVERLDGVALPSAWIEPPASAADYAATLRHTPALGVSSERLQALCLEAESRFPNDFGVLRAAGQTLSRIGLLDQAVSRFEQALRIDEGSEAVRLDLADALLQVNQFERAEAVLAPLQSVHPNSSMLQFLNAQLAMTKGDFARAYGLFDTAPNLGPVPGVALAFKGECAEKAGDVRRALDAYEAFLRGAPPSPLRDEVEARVAALRKTRNEERGTK